MGSALTAEQAMPRGQAGPRRRRVGVVDRRPFTGHATGLDREVLGRRPVAELVGQPGLAMSWYVIGVPP